MTAGGDVLALGEAVDEKDRRDRRATCRSASKPHLVSNQPHVVDEAVGEFTKTLWEAIAIVLGVSFLALGWRPGIVVAIAIPLVLAITFAAMLYFGISLQRISLGALIIALGLLVDDAMIAVEMMISKLEEGADKITAATFAYTSTAFPMLTGTLVTIAGFVPVGFAAEQCRRILLHAVRRRRHRACRFVDRRGAVHAADRRLHSARQDARPTWPRRPEPHSRDFSIAFCALKYLVLAARRRCSSWPLFGMRLRAAAVLPGLGPARAAVNVTLPQNCLDQRHERNGRAHRRSAQGRQGHRLLDLLCRAGRDTLLPAARRPARQQLLCPGRRRHQRATRSAPAFRRVSKRHSKPDSRMPWSASARSNSDRLSAGR